MDARETKQRRFLKAHFGNVWPAHLLGFSRLLVHLSARFGGDLDLALILAIIGSRMPPESWTQELEDLGRLSDTRGKDGRQLPINVHSIAESSGIPRETVRRKVGILEDRGWITRDADGHLAIARDAASDLKDSTVETMAYLTTLLKAFEAAQAVEKGGAAR